MLKSRQLSKHPIQNKSKTDLVFALLLMTTSSFAGLGDHEVSIKNDRVALKGKLQVIAKENFTIHEIKMGSTNAREYVLPNGIIFAVTWRGIAEPDLTVLLGSYFEGYEKTASLKKERKRGVPHSVKTNQAVIEKSGHQRDVRGKAYLPELMPKDLSPEELS